MAGLLYTLFIGFWLCMILITFGIMLCCTIIGIPPGLAMIALGFKSLTLQRRPKVVVSG